VDSREEKLNPYESADVELENEQQDESTSDGLDFRSAFAVSVFLTLGNIALYVFVGVLFWLGGPTAVFALLVGVPIALLLTLLLVYRLVVGTQQQRHEYLREKRRRIRTKASSKLEP